ncbi:MAG: aldo/keto reductase, partial [Eubacteriales bacterium]|nr:aldo/keto reductase [Eubacteriales bacterium]
KVREGKILHYGCSNWRLPRVLEAAAYAAAHGLQGFCCDQIMWSLAETAPGVLTDDTLVSMDDAFFAYHQESRMAAMAYSSQGKGYFARAAAGKTTEKDEREFGTPRNRAVLEALRKISARTGIPVSTLAVHAVTAQTFPAVPIVSSGNPAHLYQALAAAALCTDARWAAQLNALARGGEYPKANA